MSGQSSEKFMYLGCSNLSSGVTPVMLASPNTLRMNVPNTGMAMFEAWPMLMLLKCMPRSSPPIHTPATRFGITAMNHPSLWFWVVPVLPPIWHVSRNSM